MAVPLASLLEWVVAASTIQVRVEAEKDTVWTEKGPWRGVMAEAALVVGAEAEAEMAEEVRLEEGSEAETAVAETAKATWPDEVEVVEAETAVQMVAGTEKEVVEVGAGAKADV
eukprot:898111-Prymnesium_polylepis.1